MGPWHTRQDTAAWLTLADLKAWMRAKLAMGDHTPYVGENHRKCPYCPALYYLWSNGFAETRTLPNGVSRYREGAVLL